jgi:glutathione S-transferase
LERSIAAGQLVGSAVTYADLSLFQIVEGLVYAFPRRMQRTLREVPRVAALHRAIAQRPRIRAYLDSNRRIAFNEQGIFRHYPEHAAHLLGTTEMKFRIIEAQA